MEIPIRCFTCGSVIANKWQPFVNLLRDGKTQKEAVDTLRVFRPCCRTMLISHIDLSTRLLKFNAMQNEMTSRIDVQFGIGDDLADDSDGDN